MGSLRSRVISWTGGETAGDIAERRDRERAAAAAQAAAAEKRRQEFIALENARRKERDDRIARGRSAIAQAFAGFNDDFYNRYRQAHSGYYLPQLDRQHDKAKEDLMLRLIERGTNLSTSGINKRAELAQRYNDQRRALAARGVQVANDLRNRIQARKEQLHQQNIIAADPGQAQRLAVNSARSIAPTPEFSPLANAFTGLFNEIGNWQQLDNRYQQDQLVNQYLQNRKPGGVNIGPVSRGGFRVVGGT